MANQAQNSSQQSSNFTVNVKLLTNEVYEIQTHPDTLISQFKRLIQDRIKVPVERQKIVFGGKALLDQRPLKQYIHQSGLTVHLIAKSAPPPTTETQRNSGSQQNQGNNNHNNIQQQNNNQAQNSNNNQAQNSNNNQAPNMNLNNPFANIFGAMQNPSDPNQFTMNIGNAVNSLFGNMGIPNSGIRVVAGTINGQPINNIPTNPNQNGQPTRPQPQPQQVPPQPFNLPIPPQPFNLLIPPQNLNMNQAQNDSQNNNPQNLQQPVSSFGFNRNSLGQNIFNRPTYNHSPNINNPSNSQQNNQAHTNNHSHTHQINSQRIFDSLYQLQTSLNRVNQPYTNVPGSSTRQITINYLKRMQSQMLRTAAQLNRSIHMLQEGHTSHMYELVPVFNALSSASQVAVNLIHRGQPQGNRGNNLSVNQNTTNVNINNQNRQNLPQGNNQQQSDSQQNSQQQEIMATIVIEAEDVDVDVDVNSFQNMFGGNSSFNLPNMQINSQYSNQQQRTNNNTQLPNVPPSNKPQSQPAQQPASNQPQHNVQSQTRSQTQNQGQTAQQPKIMDFLGNAMNPNNGFNFSNLFAPQRPANSAADNPMPNNNTQQTNTSYQPSPQNINAATTSQPSQQPLNATNQPNPLNAFQGINLMNIFGGTNNNQQTSQNNQTYPTNSTNPTNQQTQPNQVNQPNQPQNPLQGINIMGMLGGLQQNGGIGALFGMSIGSMLEQQGQSPSVYSALLAPVTGSQVMACFTTKDFSFISRKRQQFREAILRAISIAGSRQDLVNKYTQDIQKLLVPRQNINRLQICNAKVRKIIHKYIQRIVNNFLNAPAESNLSQLVMGDIKHLYCESIEEISHYTDNIDQVFLNLKTNVITEMDKMTPGLSGMFYSIIQRDLVKVYREYQIQKRRKQAQSQQQAKDQADLLRMIEQASKQDVAYMSSFQHSKYYPQEKKK